MHTGNDYAGCGWYSLIKTDSADSRWVQVSTMGALLSNSKVVYVSTYGYW